MVVGSEEDAPWKGGTQYRFVVEGGENRLERMIILVKKIGFCWRGIHIGPGSGLRRKSTCKQCANVRIMRGCETRNEPWIEGRRNMRLVFVGLLSQAREIREGQARRARVTTDGMVRGR